MNQDFFLEFLQSLNLYPNNKVANRIFEVLDLDHNRCIDFREFINLIFFMLNDNLQEKILFVFKMVSENGEGITNQDLRRFYQMVNFDPMNSEIERKQANLESQEMANIIFYEFSKSRDQVISRQDFLDFLQQNKNLLSLFDFLNQDNNDFKTNWRQQKRLSFIHSQVVELQEDILEISHQISPLEH